jgi:hypothetical protein
MAIVETKQFTRPVSTVNFIQDSGSSARAAMLSSVQSYLDSGAFKVEYSITDNTLTTTTTYADLATYSACDTAMNVTYDAAFHAYMADHGIKFVSGTHTGIDNPFRITTVYTAPAAGNEFFNTLASTLPTVMAFRLQSLDATDTVITMVHECANSEEYSDAKGFADYEYVSAMQEAGITRTVTYETVTAP